jgi:hypothetical protein
MASYKKTVDIIDSLTSARDSADGTYIRPPVKIWRSNNRDDFFIPIARSDKLYISWMLEPGTGGSGKGNNAVFLVDWAKIPVGKKVIIIELFFYARNSYDYKIENPYYEATLSKVAVGWNKITFLFSYDVPEYLAVMQQWQNDVGLWLEIDSNRGQNKPYAVITYEDVPPKVPTNLYPNNIIVNARGVIRFNWIHNSEEKTQQKGFTLQYSTDNGSTWVTVSQTTQNQYYNLPANTLPLTSEILWKLKTKDQNDLESPYANGKFNTAIAPPKAPILKSPTTGYLDGEKPIKFEWEFVQGTSEDVQDKYDLEYSLDKGLNWTKIAQTSNNQYHILPGNTLPSGNIYWRIKTYNQFGDVSPYSEIANFYVIASPPLPQIIDVSNNAKPLIKWNSTGQQIFEIQILQNDKIILDTGQTIGVNIREYKVDKYLNDGDYTVKLRVTNEYSLNSPWAELVFTIETQKPPKPEIDIYSGEYGVVIKSADNCQVYRDNIYIGNMIDGYFIDCTGENHREYKYFIRIIDNNDNFNDSDKKLGWCCFRYNTLAPAKEPENFMLLKYGLNNMPEKTTSVGNIGNLVYFDGREYPTVEFTEFKELNKTLSFQLKDREELDSLLAIVDKKQVLLYRDIDGENIKGVVFHVDFERVMFGYKVDFTITRVGDSGD